MLMRSKSQKFQFQTASQSEIPLKITKRSKYGNFNFVVEYPTWVSIKRTLAGKLSVGGRNFIPAIRFSSFFNCPVVGCLNLYLKTTDPLTKNLAQSAYPLQRKHFLGSVWSVWADSDSLSGPGVLRSKFRHPIWVTWKSWRTLHICQEFFSLILI